MGFLRCASSILFIAGASTMMAQTPAAPRAPGPRPMLNIAAIPRPPVPADPLELAMSPAQPVQDAQQRIAAVTMLSNAHDSSNVRAHAYDLKTQFVSSGGLSSDGTWMLEDVSAGHAYRWTAQGPAYSAINVYPNSSENGLYGSASGDLPLRLAQVRAAIFFVYPVIGPRASVRTVTGLLDGVEQNCLLVENGAGKAVLEGSRNWTESEYCMDAKTGLLTTYSVAPGIFVHYDYSSGIKFHGKSIPTSFKITEAGQTVVEAQTISVSDPPASPGTLFSTAGLAPIGVGREMNPPLHLHMTLPVPGQPLPSSNAMIQVVVLHGSVSAQGLIDSEILASTDPALNQTAIEHAGVFARSQPTQPGATQQFQEMILTLEFITASN